MNTKPIPTLAPALKELIEKYSEPKDRVKALMRHFREALKEKQEAKVNK